jgi:hypothetical protein
MGAELLDKGQHRLLFCGQRLHGYYILYKIIRVKKIVAKNSGSQKNFLKSRQALPEG